MTKEESIRAYYSGWEKKESGPVDGVLADGFTFTSPNDDDHIDNRAFKTKCWPQADWIERFDLESVIARDNEAFVKYLCWTKNGKSFARSGRGRRATWRWRGRILRVDRKRRQCCSRLVRPAASCHVRRTFLARAARNRARRVSSEILDKSSIRGSASSMAASFASVRGGLLGHRLLAR
jgi:hypothetical protein